jgi:hypothetical protein
MAKIIRIGIAAFVLTFFPSIGYTSETDNHIRILEHTVTITITAPELSESTEVVDEALPIPYDEYRPITKTPQYVVAEALGTLITSEDETLIVTHDHWSLLQRETGSVRIGDSTGVQLLELDLTSFKGQIVHRDGGTMILDATPWSGYFYLGISSLSKTYTGAVHLLGEYVHVVYRDEHDGIVATKAVVASVDHKASREIIRLKLIGGVNLNGGDSGGGIWYQGSLLANTWTTIVGVDGRTGAEYATDSSIAALIPPPSTWRVQSHRVLTSAGISKGAQQRYPDNVN